MLESLAEFLGAFLILAFFSVIVMYIVQVIAYWKIFTKAGEKGWKALIPFYNTFTEFKIVWNTTYFWIYLICIFISSFVSVSTQIGFAIVAIDEIINLLLSIMKAYKTSLAFGHHGGYAVGLFFLPHVFAIILGFGKSQYVGKQDVMIGKCVI